jgi:hypothetical protein
MGRFKEEAQNPLKEQKGQEMGRTPENVISSKNFYFML